MCGIVAVFSPNGGVEAGPIKRAMQALDHRGPDGQGSWISQDSKIGLGHARLSIIDLETGSQPIANEDNSLHVVVNGVFAESVERVV